VFIGHGVTFVNDKFPRATNGNGSLQTEADWSAAPTVVRKGATIGSGATILCNVTIGENSIVGAGSVVTRDVPPDTIVAGCPAHFIRSIRDEGSFQASGSEPATDSPVHNNQRETITFVEYRQQRCFQEERENRRP
jgi:acetyltransferase-like isoleucine patch superfamily enzyme